MRGLMATTDCTCDLWMPSVSSKLNGIRSKLSFGYSSPRPRVLWYSLMSFHSALYCYINYWRLSLMASIVVTTWCINSVSPFYVYECAVSIRSCLIQKLRLWSLCFILNSCITSCSVEFCRDSYRRNLQKLQIALLKLKINFFLGKQATWEWADDIYVKGASCQWFPVLVTTLFNWFWCFLKRFQIRAVPGILRRIEENRRK